MKREKEECNGGPEIQSSILSENAHYSLSNQISTFIRIHVYPNFLAAMFSHDHAL